MTRAVDPRYDLLLERTIDARPELVWAAWTQPEHIKKWFTPAPWQTTDCEIDLRPGGIFRTVMRGPQGQEYSNAGCYLEIVPGQRLVWTILLAAGYRPAVMPPEMPPITAVIAFEPHGNGTRYSALVMHRDEDGRKTHEAMGFHEGWGTALDQLVTHIKTMR